MAIYQPSNVIPSSFAGVGLGVVDVNNNILISWQVNGNSPMTAFRIQIYNNASSTNVLVKDTNIISLTAPFYGVGHKGNPQQFSTSEYIKDTTWANWGLSNGNEYKMTITQYWGTPSSSSPIQYPENQSAVQWSGSVFTTQETPSVSIAFSPELNAEGQGTVANQGFTASVTPESTLINSVRWQFGSIEGSPIESVELDDSLVTILDDTGAINTSVLEYTYDGLFSGNIYVIKCTVEAQDGLTVSTSWQAFEVNYVEAETSAENEIAVECLADDSVLLSWAKAKSIQGEISPSGTQPTVKDGLLLLNEGETVTWDKINDEAMNIEPPFSLCWKVRSPKIDISNKVNDQILRDSDISPNNKYITGKRAIMDLSTGETVINMSSPSFRTAFYSDTIILTSDRDNRKKITSYLLNYESGSMSVNGIEECPFGVSGFIFNPTKTQVLFYDSIIVGKYIALYNITVSDNVVRFSIVGDKISLPNQISSRFRIVFSPVGDYLYYYSYDEVYIYKISTNEITLVNTKKIPELYFLRETMLYCRGMTFIDNNYAVIYGRVMDETGKPCPFAALLKIDGEEIFFIQFLSDTTNGKVFSNKNDDGINSVTIFDNKYNILLHTERMIYVFFVNSQNSDQTTLEYTGIISIPSSFGYLYPRIINNNAYISGDGTLTTLNFNSGYSLVINETKLQVSGLIFQIIGENQTLASWFVGSDYICFGFADNSFFAVSILSGNVVKEKYFSINNYFTTINSLKLIGQQDCDWLYITNEDIDINGTFSPKWTENTIFLADFLSENDALQAGTFASGGSIVNSLYRIEEGENTLKPIYSIPTSINRLKDYGLRSGKSYAWELFYLDRNSAYSMPIKSQQVCKQLRAYILIEASQDKEFPNVYHVVKTWRFSNNLSVGGISNNNTPNWLTNFTPYRLRQPSSRLGQSGTLQALLSNYNQSENFYKDTVEMMDELKRASISVNTFFLKDMKGNLYMVGISGPITQTVSLKSKIQEVTISVPWEEVGDATNVALIQLPTDEGWADNQVFEMKFNANAETGILSAEYPENYVGTTFEINDREELLAKTPLYVKDTTFELENGQVIAEM